MFRKHIDSTERRIALYRGGAGEVRCPEVSFKDLNSHGLTPRRPDASRVAWLRSLG